MSKRRTIADGWVPIRHGIPSSYNRGCRCDECRAANTRKHREAGVQERHRLRNYAARVLVCGRMVAPNRDDRHGQVDTYNRFGCRCPACVRAHTQYNASRRAAS